MKNILIGLLVMIGGGALAWDEQSSYSYDAAGRLVAVIVAAGGTNGAWCYVFDSVDNLTREMRYGPENTNVDYDVDGLTDAAELLDFGSLLETWTDDFDGDQFANGAEYSAGTSATNADSFLGLQSPTRTGPGMVIRWQSVDAKRYRIERSTNLLGASWSLVSSNILGIAPMNTETDSAVVGSGPWLYRVRVE